MTPPSGVILSGAKDLEILQGFALQDDASRRFLPSARRDFLIIFSLWAKIQYLMRQYEILEHIADLKIKAYGKDLPEVFVNMALGVASQQIKKAQAAPADGQYQKIIVQSGDLPSLFIDWLNEILYQGEMNQKVYLDFKVLNFSENKIEAEMAGLPIEERLIEIKAATYHEMQIKKTNNHWEATVIFDV